MACHELAALRLGMMQLFGIEDEAERQHELAELGAAAETPGPLKSMMEARTLADLRQQFAASLVGLEERAAKLPAGSPEQPYMRSLLILTRKVELELGRHGEALNGLFRDLEEVHDYVHEIYPAG